MRQTEIARAAMPLRKGVQRRRLESAAKTG